MLLFHNHGVFQRFVDELRHTYGDVETLNEAWGLVYWSHRLSHLGRPVDARTATRSRSTTWPGGRFQAELTTEFIAWQADIVREYARDDQFVTTCIAYDRPDRRRRRPDPGASTSPPATRTTPCRTRSRVPEHRATPAGLDDLGCLGAVPERPTGCTPPSRRRSWSPRPTPAPSAGRATTSRPTTGSGGRPPGRSSPAAREMIEYWHWHTIHFGTETYWGGILPHDQQPGRVYARAGPARRRLPARRVPGRRPAAGRRHRDALLGAIQVGAGLPGSLPQPGQPSVGVARRRGPAVVPPDLRSLLPRHLRRRRAGADHPRRPDHRRRRDDGLDPADGGRASCRCWSCRVCWSPTTRCSTGCGTTPPPAATWCSARAPRTATRRAGPGIEVKPARLAEAAGVRYQEFSNLGDPLPVIAESDGAQPVGRRPRRPTGSTA